MEVDGVERLAGVVGSRLASWFDTAVGWRDDDVAGTRAQEGGKREDKGRQW